jgi:hypothetical protein
LVAAAEWALSQQQAEVRRYSSQEVEEDAHYVESAASVLYIAYI